MLYQGSASMFSAVLDLPRRTRAAMALAAALLLPTGGGAVAASPAPPPPAGCTGPVSSTWIKVVVEGVHDNSGQITITLYADDSSRFLIRHGSLYIGRTPAVAGTTTSCIFVPHPGVYVLAVYHDANGNGNFDRNSLGLPAEAYGFSNNPPTLLGLPAFRSVRIEVPRSGMATHIQLKYP